MTSGTRVGIAGLTTSQMQDPANYATTYAGWDFANTWSTPGAGYYPQLFGVNYVLRVDTANASRVYGDANPAFSYSIYGLHAGDTSSILSGLSLSTAATTSSAVGSYAILASGGTATSVSGQAYRIVDAAGALTVTARPITVAADAQNRVYGDANPLLTYRIGGPGLVNGDALSGGLATAAAATSNVGAYAITQGTLANANYSIAYTGADLTVTARPITVAADAQSRLYGDANPLLTYRIGGLGPGQRGHAFRRAGHDCCGHQQCRHLRHHARHARQRQLQHRLHGRRSHGDGATGRRGVGYREQARERRRTGSPSDRSIRIVRSAACDHTRGVVPAFLVVRDDLHRVDIFGLQRSGYTGCSHRPAIAGSVPELDPQATTFRSARAVIIGPQRSPAACAGVAKAGQAIITLGCNAVKTCRISLVIIRINQSLP